MSLKRNWNLYVIHHSHTDIGYTERQDKIIRYHYDFIRQAIDILDQIHEHGKSEYKGFVWQCENYWQVENFYEFAREEEKKKFEYYVSTGEIGLSGNYLNMTELVHSTVLNEALKKAEQYGNEINHPITVGMCADINGLAWGYCDSLYEHGIYYFYSCLHPHHGMFPLWKKVQPFFWESPKGNQILVWNGEHYHFGNELFLAPNGGTSYMIHDEFSMALQQKGLLNQNAENTENTELNIAATRIRRYLEQLECENYPYDLVPCMVSGVITDNAPPSMEIVKRIQKLNEIFSGEITLQMVNLEDFFKEVENNCPNIPVYKGDWTDWWADGVGSTPSEVKLYREAVRKYNICKKIDPDSQLGDETLIKQAEKNFMLYAEHTWGYSSSVSEPWEGLVNALELKKGSYAVNAHSLIGRNLDQILAAKGEITIQHNKPQIYGIINPHNNSLHTTAYLYIEFWEYLDGIPYNASMPIEVIDCDTGIMIPCQVKQIARATQVEIELQMKAKEEKRVRIQLAAPSFGSVKNHAYIGAEGIEDILITNEFRADIEQVETDHFMIKMNSTKGIYSIIHKKDKEELLRTDTENGAFSGIYEVTDIETSACETRRKMGRNRKSSGTRRYTAALKSREVIEHGDLYTGICLNYSLTGTNMYTLFIKAYKHLPKIEVMVRIHKESKWEPENLYVALPFTTGQGNTTYLDKTGCIIRPGIDQLPGSCQDFYLIQNGILFQNDKKSLTLITKDAPLVTLGTLESTPIKLSNGNDLEQNNSPLYSWIMNNYWETNFKVNLGGFYEFSYTLTVDSVKSPETLYELCEAESESLLTYYTQK